MAKDKKLASDLQGGPEVEEGDEMPEETGPEMAPAPNDMTEEDRTLAAGME